MFYKFCFSEFLERLILGEVLLSATEKALENIRDKHSKHSSRFLLKILEPNKEELVFYPNTNPENKIYITETLKVSYTMKIVYRGISNKIDFLLRTMAINPKDCYGFLKIEIITVEGKSIKEKDVPEEVKRVRVFF